MLKIRLKRIGCKKKPFYKIVVMSSTSKRDGKMLLTLGSYDVFKKIININKTLLVKAIQSGAYPTNTVRHLIYQIFPSI